MATHKTPFATIGWREWLDFPALGANSIKAKIDTGARSSALHAEDVELYKTRTGTSVRFTIFPKQRSKEGAVRCTAKLHDQRWVRSSNGKREMRPVIRTSVSWGGYTWDIDLTLTSRDMMGFRMLLGREAVRQRYLVDPGKSYLGGKRAKAKAKKT